MAFFSSSTVADWAVVMSSKTPKAPRMMPPKSNPCKLISVVPNWRYTDSSLPLPNSRVRWTKATAKPVDSPNVINVLRTAIEVRLLKPWARYNENNAMTKAPMRLIISGFLPAIICGVTNLMMTPIVIAKPRIELTPRQRLNNITTSKKITVIIAKAGIR